MLGLAVSLCQPGCQWIGGIHELELNGDASAASPSSWCASLAPPPTLCIDFDEGPSLAPWDTPMSGATLGVDTTVSDSPPGSLRVDVPSLAAGQSAFAGLTQSVAAPSAEVRVELEYLAAADTDDKIIELVWPSTYAVAVVLPATGPVETIPVQETIPGANGAVSYVTPVASASPSSPPDPTLGPWVKIALVVHVADEAGAASVDVQIAGASWSAPLSGFPSGAQSSLLVRVGGVFVDDSPSGWSAHFDNVAVTIQ